MELFEREMPLRALEEALEEVRMGKGRLTLISGEAGIGKTTLVEHFTTRLAEPVSIYWGACDALFDSYRIYLLGWLARLHFETGRWNEAEREAASAVSLHRGESVIPIPSLIVLGHLKVRRGEKDAQEWLEQARSLALPTAELQRIEPLAAACAEAAWCRGDVAQVNKEARLGYEMALHSQNPWILGQLSYWLWRSDGTEVPVERLADPYR